MRSAAQISPDDTRRPPVKHALRKWLFSAGKRSSLRAPVVVVVGEGLVRAGLEGEESGGGVEVITWLGGLMGELIKRGHERTLSTGLGSRHGAAAAAAAHVAIPP